MDEGFIKGGTGGRWEDMGHGRAGQGPACHPPVFPASRTHVATQHINLTQVIVLNMIIFKVQIIVLYSKALELTAFFPL